MQNQNQIAYFLMHSLTVRQMDIAMSNLLTSPTTQYGNIRIGICDLIFTQIVLKKSELLLRQCLNIINPAKSLMQKQNLITM